MEPSRISRIVSFVVLVGIIVVCGILFYRVMAGFLLPLFLAALLVVIFRPVHRWMVVQCKGHESVAAGLTTAAILLIVLIPLLWVLLLAVMEGVEFVQAYGTRGDRNVAERVDDLRKKWGLDIPHEEALKEIRIGLQYLIDQVDDDGTLDAPRPAAAAMIRRLGAVQHRTSQLAMTLAQEVVRLSKEAQAHQESDQRRLARKAERTRARVELAITQLEQLRDALGTLGEDVPKTDGDAESLDDVEWQPRLDTAMLAYGRFRQTYLGGTPWSWLVEAANPDEQQINQWKGRAAQFLQHWLLSVTGATTARIGSTLLGLGIMTIGMYYFFKDGPGMIRTLMRLSPLDDQYERQLIGEFDAVSRAVVVATLLSAVVQGLLAGIGYYFAGVGSVFLLMMLTMVFAMIPFIGAAAVWIPAALWLAFNDHMVAAVILGIYGACIVSMADNVIKPLILHGQSRLHPLLALLSVLGGVTALGPIGILVGPMVVSFLQALLNMLQTELAKMGES
jgi:predicted PurR-regulated permease PerM